MSDDLTPIKETLNWVVQVLVAFAKKVGLKLTGPLEPPAPLE